MAAAICGTMPSVQPNAAATLARDPRLSAAASVYSTPVPGETMTISEVMRKASEIGGPRSIGFQMHFEKLQHAREGVGTGLVVGADHRHRAVPGAVGRQFGARQV